MKRNLLIVQIILLLTVWQPAMAQDHRLPQLEGSLGLHIPLDVTDSVDAHVGFNGSLRYRIIDRSTEYWSTRLQYSVFTARGNRYIHLLLPAVEYTPKIFGASRWEVGIGVGPLLAWNNGGQEATDLGTTLSLRYLLPHGQAAEIQYMHGPKEGETGLLLGIVFPLTK